VAGPVVKVEGARELRATMKRAGEDLSDLKEAHGKIGAVVKAATHPPNLTGALAGSIRTSGTKTQAVIRAGGARVPYAGVQEWGWPSHNITGQGYLTGAAKATEPTWTAIYRAEVEKILDRIRGA
jgi:phage gpG-like protein